MPQPTILVIHAYSRNGLAAINGLAAQNRLIAAHPRVPSGVHPRHDRWFASPAVEALVRYAPYAQRDRFRDDLIAICNRFAVDGIMPVGTKPTNLVSALKPELEAATNAVCVVETYDKLRQVSGKDTFAGMCAELNIKTPKTVVVETHADWSRVESELRFPIIVKPGGRSASAGIVHLDTAEAYASYLQNQARHDLADYGPYVVQEIIPGPLHDVTACAHNGKPTAILSQQRLETGKDFGGGGLINVTTREPDLIDMATKIIRHTDWSGIIEFDFIRATSGEPYMLECNPKVWGTTQLTLDAGANVVQQAVDIFVHGKAPVPVGNYETGLVGKWVFPEIMPNRFRQHDRTFKSLCRHLAMISKRYHQTGGRTRWNLRWGSIRHLIGQFFNSYVLPKRAAGRN